MDSKNKLDIIPKVGQTVLPSFEWKGLGAAFADGPAINNQSLSAQCKFVVRQGFDPVDQSLTDRVVEGAGDLGATIRHKSLAFSLTLGNISLKSGHDDPQSSMTVGDAAVPSMKATIAKEYKNDQFVAISYDLKQKKPEVSIAWSGQTSSERASLVVHADPFYRTYKLGAAVSFPGPEWRVPVYNENDDCIEDPVDEGARHKLWVQHEIKDKQWMHRTRIGAALDLGRLANFMADYVDNNLERFVPNLFWRIPFSGHLYNMLVPAEDENQVRHEIRNWDLDISHDFDRKLPVVGLTKHLKYASISTTYDAGAREVGLEYSRSGVRLGARLGHLEGVGWKSPSLVLHVEPLSLL